MEDKKSGIRVPTWLIILAIAAILFLGYLAFRPTREDIKKAEVQRDSIATKIDDKEKSINQERGVFTNTSQNRAEEANQITNSRKYENPVISDTTYAAKCEYIKSRRPE